MLDTDVNTTSCGKCAGEIVQFDTDGGLWVGDVKRGGSYNCPSGALHEPVDFDAMTNREFEAYPDTPAKTNYRLSIYRAENERHRAMREAREGVA